MLAKKSQGLSLTTIVIAVIVLIVLIVLIVIFLRWAGYFGTGIEDCPSKGGLVDGPIAIDDNGNPVDANYKPCEKYNTGDDPKPHPIFIKKDKDRKEAFYCCASKIV